MEDIAPHWEPYFLLGQTARKDIGARVGKAVTEWLSESGWQEVAEALECSVQDPSTIKQLAALLRHGRIFEATAGAGEVVTLILPGRLVDFLLPKGSPAGRLAVSSDHVRTPIADAVELELVRGLIDRISGQSGKSWIMATDVGSVTDWLIRMETSRSTVVEVEIRDKRQFFLLDFSPGAIQAHTPGHNRTVSTPRAVQRRSESVADLRIGVQGELPATTLTLADISQLEVGDVLLLGPDADKEVLLTADRKPFANGTLGRVNECLAICISGLIDHFPEGKRL